VQLVGFTLGLYLLLTGAMFVMQRSLLYPAGRERPDIARYAAHGIQVVQTQTAEGLILTHWYLPPPNPEAPVIVAFHGNAGHLGDRVPKLLPVAGAGFGLLLAGYRGYGGNPGQPSEAHLTADAHGLLDWLEAQGTGPDRTVLYGESLGSGIAVKMSAEGRGAAVVLESPYSSVADVAQMHYWYLPARWLILDGWNSLRQIARKSAPLLVLHGTADRTIPLKFGQALYDAAPEPKELVVVPEAGHVDLLERPEVLTRVIAFLHRHTRR
jgi:fermentation-respiration switch protein FrsA (DUF1100 family)